MEELLGLFRKTIEDKKLSNAEKKALLKILKEKKIRQQQIQVLRSQIFEVAREELQGYSALQIVEWLEKANKLLLKYENNQNSYPPSRVYFSPGNQCREQIIKALHQAKKNVDICVFTISDDKIAEEIIFTHKRFIDVRIITDDEKTKDRGSDIAKMKQAGVPIKIDNDPDHMHHKFMIIDDFKIVTGSYNWTRSAATYNQENLLINHEPNIISRYQREFNKLWNRFGNYSKV